MIAQSKNNVNIYLKDLVLDNTELSPFSFMLISWDFWYVCTCALISGIMMGL